MSHEARELIVSTWRRVEPVSEAAAELFYERLFMLDPELRVLFANADMARQRRMLVEALGMVVRATDDLATIRPALEALGRRHVGYGVGGEPLRHRRCRAALDPGAGPRRRMER